jgi:hypothetical protein
MRPEVLWCSNPRGGTKLGWKFPSNVRRRILADTAGKSVLHLFGGQAGFGTRLDVDVSIGPDVVGDAWLPPFAFDSFDVVVLDPPYYQHANAYAKATLFRAAAWIARERVIWFSTLWASAAGGLANERAWLVRCGDNHLVRALQYFHVSRPKLKPVVHFKRGPAMKYNRWVVEDLSRRLFSKEELCPASSI